MTLTNGWTHPDAACRGMNPELFHPTRGGSIDPKAIATCAQCPVKHECLEWAIDHNEKGIWAGTTERQRANARRNRPRPPHTTQLILTHIHTHPDHEWTAEQLADRLGRGHSTVREACQKLRRKGLVSSHKRPNNNGTRWVTTYTPPTSSNTQAEVT